MKDSTKLSFAKLYESIILDHSAIINLRNDIIIYIDDEAKLENQLKNTIIYITSCVGALFAFATIPILIHKAYSLIIYYHNDISKILYQKDFLNSHPSFIFSSILLFIGILFYTIIIPSAFSSRFINLQKYKVRAKSRVSEEEFIDIIKNNIIFKVFVIMLNYMLIFVAMIYICSYNLLPKIITKTLLIIYMMVPVFLLSIMPTILLILIIIMLFFPWIKLPKEASPTIIIYYLTKLIHKLDNIDEISFITNDSRRKIIRLISKISVLMIRMYRERAYVRGITGWPIEEMIAASENFKSLASWVYFPQKNTLENLRERLCIYLNIFISGYYHELPRGEINKKIISSTNSIKSLLQKIITLFFLGLYVSLPIIIYIIANSFIKIEMPTILQPLYGILYIVWVTIGLISFGDALNPETMDFLKDIIKLWIKKK